MIQETLRPILLSLLDQRREVVLRGSFSFALFLPLLITEKLIMYSKFLGIVLSFRGFFSSHFHAPFSLLLCLLGVSWEAGHLLALDGLVDDIAESLVVFQYIAQYDSLVKRIHVALTVFVGIQHISLLLIRSLVFLGKLLDGIARNGFLKLFPVVVTPVESLRIHDGFGCRASLVVSFTPSGV
ncbi:hypothetical protein HG531_012793 [Fusarium graminearum]|nr:hypothetical protein HG531_012793 [Fusarium graminearum]